DAFVDVLAAREIVRFARASIDGVDAVLEKSVTLYEQGVVTKVDVNRIKIQRDTAQVALADAEAALRQARRALGELLNIPPAQAETLHVRGSLRVSERPLPPIDQLIAIALKSRPDVRAFLLGVSRALADIRLARANRF